MAITVSNILVGEGNLFLAPVTIAAGGTLANVGATQDGVEISWEPTMVDIEVDQFGDAAKVIQEKIKCMIKTKLAEATLVNLAYAWGYNPSLVPQGGPQATSAQPGIQAVALSPAAFGGVTYPGVSSQVFNLGIHIAQPEERALLVTGVAPGYTATVSRTRTYSCNRVISYATSTQTLKRGANSQIPVEFRVLPDPTQTGSEYGKITDQVSN